MSGTNTCPPATLVLSSTAGAAESQGDLLGEYRREGEWGGRGYWRQRDDVGEERYLHYNKDKDGGSWVEAKELGGRNYLRSLGDSELPPETGWEYWGEGGEWRSERSLAMAYSPLVPCTGVTVAMEGEAARWDDGDLQGMYRPTGQWSEGRPVYRGEEGNRGFLMVMEGQTVWSIQSTVTFTWIWIRSGRGTNSPGDPRAGGSQRFGLTRWEYWDGGWKEGDITVTCEM